MTPVATPAEALEAVLCLVEEGLEASDCVLDPAAVSWTKAVAVVLELRQKLLEAKACVAESRVALPPGPLCSAALAVIRDELRRELDPAPEDRDAALWGRLADAARKKKAARSK